ncbi:hypothetical protein PGAL8A_00101200 [Plasmodium gallinaceum]|uniref:Uncharacterized protein n=1 Tax=Plasmodium gallinaceum TaxID=5849 RepID=A0A1J1GQI3_PLAGA|nr:hypothetical protein PGAL8A_00101200 [Plasmodium gallinaceum]CRG93306.1 hypothetical protein PGAL8A_00101200 [Plasmodium gallinaceum]
MPLFHSLERYNSIKLIIYAVLPLLIFIFFFNYKIEDSLNNYSPFNTEILYSSKFKKKEKEEYFSIKDIDFIKLRKIIFKKYRKYSEFFFFTDKNESNDNSKKLSNLEKFNLKNFNYEKSFEEIINFNEKNTYQNNDGFSTYKNFYSNDIKNEKIKKNDKISYIKNKDNNLKNKNFNENMLNISNEKVKDNNNFDIYYKENYKTNSVWNIIKKKALELDKYYNLPTEDNLNLKEILKIIYKITFYLSDNNKKGNGMVLGVFNKSKKEHNNTYKKKEETKLYKKRKNLLLLGNVFRKIYLNKYLVINNLVKYKVLKRIKKKSEAYCKNREKNLKNKHFIPIFTKYRNIKDCSYNDYKGVNSEKSNEGKKLKNYDKNTSSKIISNSEKFKYEYEDENITEENINNVKKIISKIELNMIEGSNTSLNLLNNEYFQIDTIYDIRNNSMILLILYNKLKNNGNSSSNLYKSELYIYSRSLNEFVENIISNSIIKNKIKQDYRKKFTNDGHIIFNNEITELKKKISSHYHQYILKLKNDLEGLRKYHKFYFNKHKRRNVLKKNNFDIINKNKYKKKSNEKDNTENIKNIFKEKNNYYERKFKNYIKSNIDIHFFLKDNISDKKRIINYLCNHNKNNDFYNFSSYMFNNCESNECTNSFFEHNSYIQKKFSKNEICKMLIHTYYDIVYNDKNIKLYEFLYKKKKLFYKIYYVFDNEETNIKNKKLKSLIFLPYYILKYLLNIINLSFEIYFFIFNDLFQYYFLFIKYSFYYFFNNNKIICMFNDLGKFHPCISFNVIKNFRLIYFFNKIINQNKNVINKKKENLFRMENYIYKDNNINFNLKESSNKNIFFDEKNSYYECLCNNENELNLFWYKKIFCKIIFNIRYIVIYLIVFYNTLVNILKKIINNFVILFNYLLFCEKNKYIYKNNLLFNYLESQIINLYDEKVIHIKYIKSNNIYSIFFLYYLLIYKNNNYYYNNDSYIYTDYFTILLKYLKKENQSKEIKKNKEICELNDSFIIRKNTCEKLNIYEKNKKSNKKNHVKYINYFINSNGWKHITTITLNSISSNFIVNKKSFDFIIKYKTYVNEEIVNRLIYFPLMNTNKLELFKDKIISINENKFAVRYKKNFEPFLRYILNIYKKMIKDREELKKRINNNNKEKKVKIYYYNTNKVLCFYYNEKKFLKKENYVNKINNYITLKKKKKNNDLLFSNRIKLVDNKNSLMSIFFFNKMKCLKNKNMLKRNNSYYIELIKKKKSINYFDEYLFYFFYYFSKKDYLSMNKKKHNFIKVNKNNISSIENKMEIIKYIYFCIFTDLRNYEEKLNILKTIKYITTTKNMIRFIEENKNLLSNSNYILTHPFINIFIEFIITILKELDDLLSFNCEKKKNLENYIIYMKFIDLKIEQLYLYRQSLYNLKIFEMKQIKFHKFILNYKKVKKKKERKCYEDEKCIKKDILDGDNAKHYGKESHKYYRKNKEREDMQNKISFYEKELAIMVDNFEFYFFPNRNYEINNELFKNIYSMFLDMNAESIVYKFYLKNKKSYSIKNIENYKFMILNYEKILKEKMKSLYRFKASLYNKIDLFNIKKKQMKKYKKYENDLKIIKKEIFLINSLNELNDYEKVLFNNYLKENLFYLYEFPHISEISLLKLTNKRIYFGNKNDNKYMCYGSVELSKLISNYEKYKYVNKKIPQLPIEISIPNYNTNKKKQNKNLKFFLIKEVNNNNEEEQIITISMYKYNNVLQYYFNIYNIYNIINLTNFKTDFLISQFQKNTGNETNNKNIQHNSSEKRKKAKWNNNVYKYQKNDEKKENYLVFYKNKLPEKRMNYSLKLKCIQKIALPTNVFKYSINLHDVASKINNTRNKKKLLDINQDGNIFSILSSLTNYYFSSFFNKTNCANKFYEFYKKYSKNYNFTDLSDLQDFINNTNKKTDKKWINSDGNIIAFLKNSKLYLSLKNSETNKMSKPYYVSLDKLPELYKSLRIIHVSFFPIENYFPFLNVMNQKKYENNFQKKLIFLLLIYEDGLLALISVYDDSDNLFSYLTNKFKSFFTNTQFFFSQVFIYFSLYILEILRCHLAENEGNQFTQIYVAFLILIDTILYPVFFFLYAIFNFLRKIFYNRINHSNVINNIDNDNINSPINR